MKPLIIARIVNVIAAIFIFTFTYAAINKLIVHHSFVIYLKSTTGLAANFLSWAIPAVELVISLLLFVPQLKPKGLVFAFGLMAVFTFYIAHMLLTTSHLPCSCGGIINKLSWQTHLWFNIFLTFLAASGMILNKQLKILLQ
jgi:hypothetical protein